MMYRQTFRLLLSNFHLVWKILLNMAICFLVVLGLSYACSLPMINVMQDMGYLDMMQKAIDNFSNSFNIYQLLNDIVLLIGTFFSIITTNIKQLWLYILLFLVIIVVVRALISGYYQFATTNVLYHYMSSNIKYSFSSSLINNVAKNLKYQLAYIVLQLPFDVIVVYTGYKVLKWMLAIQGWAILAPIVVMALLILLISFKITFFSGWMPAITVFNCSTFEGLKMGVKAVFRRFNINYSTAILTTFTLLVLNALCAICTFGASLLLTMPISILVLLIYNMVMFYNNQGMRFYIDSENIVAPKKFEDTDAMNQLKYVI